MKKILLVFLLWAAVLVTASAQEKVVTGRVTDDVGDPLPSVSVVIKGTNAGTITDFDGKFQINTSTDAVLIFSFIGFKTHEIKVGEQSNINVQLEPDSKLLDQVVVVGYGTQKKSDITGAVASVNEEELRTAITTNIDQALQGRVAGVQVTQNSGQPGGAASIRIRGANSITGSSEPLYVIDGIPVQGDGASTSGFDWAGGANGQNRVNPLSTINPNDIVSIEVLKDASATAIYGSRAANGVILVTTRSGSKGESKISYNAYYGVQEIPRTLDMMNLRQFADYQLTVAQDINQTPDGRYLDPSILGEGTNWQDEIFRSADMQNHQLAVSGGTDKTTYAVSGGYFQQNGIVIGSDFERFTTRIRLDNELKDWVKIGGNLSFANTDETITLNDGGDGIIMQALITTPATPVRDMDGNYAGPEEQNTGVSYNPVAAALIRNNTLQRNRLMGNFYSDLKLMEGLTFRSEFGFDNNQSYNKAFHPTYQWGVLENTENMLRQREDRNFFWIWKNYVTYTQKFGVHDITAMVGTEAQKAQWEGLEVTKKNFATNDIPVLSQGEQENTITNGWKDGASLASYFGRVNYGFNDKYLLTLTLRADGSSKFGPENKWGYFPSGSFAWRVKNESFMEPIRAIYDMKLRIGYGEVGNQAIPNYLYGSPLQTINTPFGTAYRMSQIANPFLKWETTKQYNIGLDLSLFSGRIDLTADAYNKQTTDMLLQLAVPNYLGGSGWWDISAPYANVGSLENKGIELALTTHNVAKGKFNWSTTLNYSANK